MYLRDSNILRHFAENHPTLHANIMRTGQTQIALPSIVVAEVLRGRSEYALKATPAQAPQAHQLLIETIALLNRFRVVPFDQQCAKVMIEIQQRSKTKKRYADVLIAATAIAKQMIVVTRNEKDFVDLLPTKQIVNWIDS